MMLLYLAMTGYAEAQTDTTYCQYDFDGSGLVDFADFLMFAEAFGKVVGKECERDTSNTATDTTAVVPVSCGVVDTTVDRYFEVEGAVDYCTDWYNVIWQWVQVPWTRRSYAFEMRPEYRWDGVIQKGDFIFTSFERKHCKEQNYPQYFLVKRRDAEYGRWDGVPLYFGFDSADIDRLRSTGLVINNRWNRDACGGFSAPW